MIKCQNILLLFLLVALTPGQLIALDIWPDTGQNKCFDNIFEITCPSAGESFYGQDAHYDGISRSYTKLGHGNVELPDTATPSDGWIMTRDNITGLIWEIKTDDNTIHDKDNTYSWCDTNSVTNGGYQGLCGSVNSENFIAAINIENFGGFIDWRLPTVKELSSLVVNSTMPDYSNIPIYEPTIDNIFFPHAVADEYWTSTTKVDAYNQSVWAWAVYFTSGGVYQESKTSYYYVRGVRGEAGRDSDDNLVVNGDDTVIDTATCLQWSQMIPETMSWQEALNYCEALELNDFSDWRLPNRNELQSLVDYSKLDPSIDTTIFPETVSTYYWSSTTSSNQTNMAKVVWFYDGHVTASHKSNNSYYVRCVRSRECSDYIDSSDKNIYGNVMYNSLPVCAMVLANGQYQFTCSGDGSFNIDVPLDSNGQVTVYSFVNGLAPYKEVIYPSEGQNMQIQMAAGGEGTGMDVSYTVGEAIANPSWVRLTGDITYNGSPVCAMALANGQYKFTCSGDGSFDLEVPLDSNGDVTLYGFCSGLPPYKEVFSVN